jgi:epoxyqueuosine reductase
VVSIKNQKPIPPKQQIIDFALTLNIDLVRFTEASILKDEQSRFESWIGKGFNAGMGWLEHNTEKRFNPVMLLEGAKTVISIAVSYNSDKSRGIISRYAAGSDYHKVIKSKLNQIALFMKRDDPGLKSKACVDASVISEKSFGVKSGIGWVGKNSILINEDLGSWFYLGELVIDREYEPDPPVIDRCGKCTACISACPAGAINSNRTINSGKCISYVTIENKNCIGPKSASANNYRSVYGCDICQEVCPWNSSAVITREEAFAKPNGLYLMSRESLSRLGPDEFASLSKGTCLERISYEKFRANLNMLTF